MLSLLGFEDLGKYGGKPGLKGIPLCYWLRCLTGKPKAQPGSHCVGGQTIPAPEVRYFPLSENRYLIQALLALCCFFDMKNSGKTNRSGHSYPFVVKEVGKNSCLEFLFLKAGQKLAVLVDQVHFHRLVDLSNLWSSVDIVVVYLQDRFASRPGRHLDSRFTIPLYEVSDSEQDQDQVRVIRVRRILPVPANELLNGLFRLRKVNRTLRERDKERNFLPEELGVMLLPFLYRLGRQLRSLPMHRARISEIGIGEPHD